MPHGCDAPEHEADDEERDDAVEGERVADAVARRPWPSLRPGHDREDERDAHTHAKPADVGAVAPARDHADRPSRSPSRPVGRIMRTSTRTKNAMTSRHELRVHA